MWSKGAVVIVKHGDPEMADQIANGLVRMPDERYLRMERENYFLKRRSKREIRKMIRRAERRYGWNPAPPPNWAKWIVGIRNLMIYGLVIFKDKYMTIQEG